MSASVDRTGPFGGFYAGCRVLVTGHTGFKGAWLVHWLQRLGAEVSGLALEPQTDPNMFAATGLSSSITSHFVNVADREAVLAAVADVEPEVILHLAAETIVLNSYTSPASAFATNVTGTANVLDAAFATDSVRAAVVVTSDKCYRNDEQIWPYREIDPLGGKDPYSASKAAQELVAQSYATPHFARFREADGHTPVRVATARAGNVIGGGDWADHRIVADLARAIASNEDLVLRNPGAVRPWQHVLEPLSGYLQLGAMLGGGDDTAIGAWNFGPALDTDAVTVGELTAQLCKQMNVSGDRVRIEADTTAQEAHLLTLDSTKARRTLGWAPAWRIDQCVEATARWYAAHLDGAEADALVALTNTQIDDYEQAAERAGAAWAHTPGG